MNIRTTILLLFLTMSRVAAQGTVSPPSTTKLDSVYEAAVGAERRPDAVLQRKYKSENQVYPKEFRSDFREAYSGPEFDYSTVKPRESMWQRFQKKIQELLASIFGELNPGKSLKITEIIIRILAIAIFGFLLYYLLRFLFFRDAGFLFRKDNSKLEIKSGEIHENIHEINFTDTIGKFEREHDFRSAVRYQFLLVLKKLSDKKRIIWNPERTNKDYITEIGDTQLKEDFADLVYIFDYVWYGEFTIDETGYNHFKEKFKAVAI